jgi:transcriptional regulator with XRE-family HTH domain
MPLSSRRYLPNSSPAEISKRIKETREARGMTASELARLVGVTPTAVWNWEKNSITPRRPALEQIAKVLGVSIHFLLTGEGETRQLDETRSVGTVASILEEAKAKLVEATGLSPDHIKLNVQFVTE